MNKNILLSYGVILLSLVAFASDNQLSKNQLLHDQSFAFFDLDVSEDEKHAIDALVINKGISINNYGDLDILEDQIIDYLQALGNDQQGAIDRAKIITKVAQKALILLDAQTGWITLRSFMPNQLFDIPRWHTDGSYYKPHGVVRYKFACAFKGPTTLFLDVPDDVRSQFRIIESQDAISGKQRSDSCNLTSRQQAAIYLQDFPRAAALAYQGSLFKVGDKKQAALHSEPPIHERRLFMSIVPGTYEQIQEWRIGHEKK